MAMPPIRHPALMKNLDPDVPGDLAVQAQAPREPMLQVEQNVHPGEVKGERSRTP